MEVEGKKEGKVKGSKRETGRKEGSRTLGMEDHLKNSRVEGEDWFLKPTGECTDILQSISDSEAFPKSI